MNSASVTTHSTTLLALLLTTACSGPSSPVKITLPDSESSSVDVRSAAVEGAVGAIGGASSAAEGISANDLATAKNASTGANCTLKAARPGPCVGGAIQTEWTNCLNKSGLRVSGRVTEVYTVAATGAADAAGCTSSIDSHNLIPDGDTLSRSSPGLTIRYDSSASSGITGATLTTDTFPPAAWDGTTFPNANLGTVVSRSGSTRQITFNGVHEVFRSPTQNTTFEQILTGKLQISGSQTTSDRMIAAGSTLTTWDNTTHLKAIHTFGADKNGAPVGWVSGCCFPTQGVITTVFSGPAALAGTTTMTFTVNCGTATFVDQTGRPVPVKLSRCL